MRWRSFELRKSARLTKMSPALEVPRGGQRERRVGMTTIALLIAGTRRLGLRPVASCWGCNRASKRSLARADLIVVTPR